MTAIYKSFIRSLDKVVPARFQPFWSHPAENSSRHKNLGTFLVQFLHGHKGPKTVFFWAPTIKWSLVIAGLGDLRRPAEKLSVSQSCALAATGAIWARYCLVIIPKNYYLCSVNVFVFCTGFYQLIRIFRYRQQLRSEEVKETS